MQWSFINPLWIRIFICSVISDWKLCQAIVRHCCSHSHVFFSCLPSRALFKKSEFQRLKKDLCLCWGAGLSKKHFLPFNYSFVYHCGVDVCWGSSADGHKPIRVLCQPSFPYRSCLVYKEKSLWNSIPSDLAPQIASTQPLPSGLSSSPINLRQLGPQVKLLWNRGLSYPSPTKAPLFQVVLGSSFASWWVILSDSSLSIPACTHIHCLTTYMSIYNMPLHTCYTRGTAIHMWNAHTPTSSHGASGASVTTSDAIFCFTDLGTKALALPAKCPPMTSKGSATQNPPWEQSAQTVLTRAPLLPLSAKMSVEMASFHWETTLFLLTAPPVSDSFAIWFSHQPFLTDKAITTPFLKEGPRSPIPSCLTFLCEHAWDFHQCWVVCPVELHALILQFSSTIQPLVHCSLALPEHWLDDPKWPWKMNLSWAVLWA